MVVYFPEDDGLDESANREALLLAAQGVPVSPSEIRTYEGDGLGVRLGRAWQRAQNSGLVEGLGYGVALGGAIMALGGFATAMAIVTSNQPEQTTTPPPSELTVE